MPGFFGFLSSFGVGVGFPGTTTGGGGFGGFFWSFFCAETAKARPATAKIVNKNCRKIFISLPLSSFVLTPRGKEGKCVDRLRSKRSAKDLFRTLRP
jgi:hypothetical protein